MNDLNYPLDTVQIRQFLPHRYPFLFVDRVDACQPNVSITGHKNVTINEPFFEGHFPSQPIMPGVLIVEAMAQLSGILAYISQGQRLSDGIMYLFAGADNIKFRRQVIPGDCLTLHVKYNTHRQRIFKFDGEVFNQQGKVASAEITLVQRDMDMLTR